ncbi:unnamed protein product [Coccothraustes coccothraustes]
MAARSAAGTCCPGTRVRSGTARRFRTSGVGPRRARESAGSAGSSPGAAFPRAVRRGSLSCSSWVVSVRVLASRCFSFAFACRRCRVVRMSREKSACGSQKLLELPEEGSRALILSH